ncbi:hypothetical protein B0I37DRAFT_186073 [Chaetomium sp. MPI-CAGE-AT-0009]|nr:hypothetical protein B0I37DRAFT_186073 [Chaetomium sp. MPI-CAGE-AT-0009]
MTQKPSTSCAAPPTLRSQLPTLYILQLDAVSGYTERPCAAPLLVCRYQRDLQHSRRYAVVTEGLDLRGLKREARSFCRTWPAPPSHQPYEVARSWGWPSASRFCRANWSCYRPDRVPPPPPACGRSIDAEASLPSSKRHHLLPQADGAEGFSQSRELSPAKRLAHPGPPGRPSPSHPRSNGRRVSGRGKAGVSCAVDRIET